MSKLLQNTFKSFQSLVLLSLLGLFFLAGPSLAQVISQTEQYQGKEYGPEYFFAISGEVSGQAAPGVQAVYVNGRRVHIDNKLNFKTNVSLKEGQKYLEIETRYRGLRFTKKYLVIRHPMAKKTFKIVVPKQEFQNIIAKAQKLPAPKKTVEKPKPAPPPKPKASFGFKKEEFKDRYTVTNLARAIAADNYGIETEAPDGTLMQINEILRRPDFYDKWKAKNKRIIMTEDLDRLIRETAPYRDKPFDQLTREQQLKIIRLNRLLIEATYPFFAPKSRPEGSSLVGAASWLGYEFVAEIEPGRMLIIRKVDGKYFGLLMDMETYVWLHLDEISLEEMQDFLEKGKVPAAFYDHL